MYRNKIIIFTDIIIPYLIFKASPSLLIGWWKNMITIAIAMHKV